ncbi:MAG: hypothetical protein Q8907_02105 [Bacteroidota bacterium]|nr:hypothetical protein [Bacteroidota bacterium]MDP4273051.1 hypothetical protein [Bacteroidota bacterium]
MKKHSPLNSSVFCIAHDLLSERMIYSNYAGMNMGFIEYGHGMGI